MPETDAPKLSLWLPELRHAVGTPNDETFLIGHSSGDVVDAALEMNSLS